MSYYKLLEAVYNVTSHQCAMTTLLNCVSVTGSSVQIAFYFWFTAK